MMSTNSAMSVMNTQAGMLKWDEIKKQGTLMEHDFLKLGGGVLKNKKQKRTLKIHQKGYLSYHDGSKVKGFFRLGPSTQCKVLGQRGDYVWALRAEGGSEGEKVKADREFQFEEPNKNVAVTKEWVEAIKQIAQKYADTFD
jgi:hypothetical protein